MDKELPMTSSQPYLIRAIYDWIIDNDFTPYLLVNAENEYAMVPQEYIEDGKIVLNINPSAVNDLQLGNDYVMFNARFNGKAMEVSVPVVAILAIYARENGQGMMFDEKDNDQPPPSPDDSSPGKKSTGEKSGKPQLKVVK